MDTSIKFTCLWNYNKAYHDMCYDIKNQGILKLTLEKGYEAYWQMIILYVFTVY